MTEIASCILVAVGLYVIVAALVEHYGTSKINALANTPIATPSTSIAHTIIKCGTCSQFVDLHNPYDLAHHQVEGHSPETIN